MSVPSSISHTVPLEIWEHVIDLCVSDQCSFMDACLDRTHSSFRHFDCRDLIACALTCRSWLPRSRHHIFHTVRLADETTFSLFLAALNSNPALGNLVADLQLICIVRASRRPDWFDRLLPHLAKLQALSFSGCCSQAVRRLLYGRSLLAQFTLVTTLRLIHVGHTSLRLEEFAQFLLAFPSLVHLELLSNLIERLPSAAQVPSIAHFRLRTLFVSSTNVGFNCQAMAWLVDTSALSSLVHFTFVFPWREIHSEEKAVLNRLLQSCADTLETATFSTSSTESTDSHSYSIIKLPRNSNLRALTLTSTCPKSLGYIAQFLAALSAPKLDRFVLEMTNDYAGFDALDWTVLDAALTQPVFDALTAVEIVCINCVRIWPWVHDTFRAMLVSRLPALHARGVLRVAFSGEILREW